MKEVFAVLGLIVLALVILLGFIVAIITVLGLFGITVTFWQGVAIYVVVALLFSFIRGVAN